MDTSFIKYFREHGMTPILMHTLETKRGWTDDMITCLIQNCNKAWGLSHVAPWELRYWDKMDTDEEMHPPLQGEKWGRDEEHDSEDSWDPDVSINTIAAGQKPAKKPRKDKCPSKQPYHRKGKGKKSSSGISSMTVTEKTMYVTGDPLTGGAKLGAQFRKTLQRGQVAMKQPRNPVGWGQAGQQRQKGVTNPKYDPSKPTVSGTWSEQGVYVPAKNKKTLYHPGTLALLEIRKYQ